MLIPESRNPGMYMFRCMHTKHEKRELEHARVTKVVSTRALVVRQAPAVVALRRRAVRPSSLRQR